MSCVAPMQGWKSKALTANGKRKVVFSHDGAFSDLPVDVPCGICIGCRERQAKEWMIRCVHEAQMWDDNCFVTLTYDEAHVPKIGGFETLEPRHFVLFMKKLRHLKPGVRFLQAGEYGKFGRPHHHALLFNCGFPDMVKLKKRGDFWLYRSKELESLWEHGYSSIGIIGAGSAKYVCKYTLKKVGGRKEYGILCPEYMTMSRKPGIGRYWLEKFGSDVYPSGKVVVKNGGIMAPPRYYDNYFKESNPVMYNDLRLHRISKRDNTHKRSSRYYAAQEIIKSRLALFNSKEV